MIVLGFSGIRNGGFYRSKYGLRFVGHDAAVALVIDGKLVFAAEEERFCREKHTSRFPVGALAAALECGGIDARDVDFLAYPWKVSLARFLHMNWHHAPRVPLLHAPELALAGLRVMRDMMWPGRIAKQFRAAATLPPLACQGVAHHRGHAACAYFPSPYDAAAVLTVDGQGEDESATLGEWHGTRYRAFHSVRSPNSIGILYGMLTDFMGMRAAWDEYKVMGMAAHGDPERFRKVFEGIAVRLPRGRYRTRRTAMVFKPGYCDRMLSEWFGIPPRRSTEPLEQVHFDLAAALQQATEAIVFHLLRRLRECSSERRLCLAGGVFQNSVLNGKIRRSGLFDEVYVPPVPGDHGGALGAALLVHHASTGAPRSDVGFSAFSGPAYDGARVERALAREAAGLRIERPDDVVAASVPLLVDGGVIAWFQGRMEYGPRALGHRSILASPLHGEMRDRINERIKHREEFRPFAGAVPVECAAEWFELDGASPFMQFVVPVRAEAADRIPAVTHHGTCRAQTVDSADDRLFHRLLVEFGRRTDVPVLLNTSFNAADEPIVCTPEDAIRSFRRMNLDALVIEGFVVRRPGLDREARAPR